MRGTLAPGDFGVELAEWRLGALNLDFAYEQPYPDDEAKELRLDHVAIPVEPFRESCDRRPDPQPRRSTRLRRPVFTVPGGVFGFHP